MRRWLVFMFAAIGCAAAPVAHGPVVREQIPTGEFISVAHPERRYRLLREGDGYRLETFGVDGGVAESIEAGVVGEPRSEFSLWLKSHHGIRVERHGEERWLDIVFCYQAALARPANSTESR